MTNRVCASPFLAPLVCAAALLVGVAEVQADPDVSSKELLEHVRRLASDKWEGRATGSDGEKKATSYIVAHFKKLGLKPAGENGGWFQTVSMPAGYDVKKGTTLKIKGAKGKLKLGTDFYPLSPSASAKVAGDAVFAGYGIAAPDLGYDDYEGLDVSGKVVFVFRHFPRAGGDRKWAAAMRAHAPFVAKLKQATDRGALALVVVNDPANFTKPQGRARRPRPDTTQKRSVGGAVGRIPYVHMTLAAAKRAFPALFGKKPEELEKSILAGEKPKPASVAGRVRVDIRAELERKQLHGRNVCAMLAATGRDTVDEVVVVGAHHDHLGYGQWGSLERSPDKRKKIHNGADDNASGTSGLLEATEYLASRQGELRRSILFITFTGEERGLVGSAYWCDHPTVPLEKIVAMVNMDMIGRLDGRKLFIGGVKTSPSFRPILKNLTEELAVDATFGDGGMAPSDNTSFYKKGLPVLFFFTGLHPEYHRPSDDWKTLDMDGMEKVARLAAWTAERVANLPERPAFTKADRGGAGPPRPVLGISVGRAEGGVAVAGLAKGGPAEKAGLKTGDLIVEIAGKPTPGPGALRQALQRKQIGDKVLVRVLRDGNEETFDVVLGGA
jgi:hypothetical protein